MTAFGLQHQVAVPEPSWLTLEMQLFLCPFVELHKQLQAMLFVNTLNAQQSLVQLVNFHSSTKEDFMTTALDLMTKVALLTLLGAAQALINIKTTILGLNKLALLHVKEKHSALLALFTCIQKIPATKTQLQAQLTWFKDLKMLS